MKFFREIGTAAITAILIGILSACAPVQNTGVGEIKGQTLYVGAVTSVDVIPILIAEEKGFFRKAGVDVHFEPFKSAKDRDAAFQAGSLDGIICDQIAICLYQNADFDVKITGSTDGDFLLIANPYAGISAISDMKNKSVAISEKTSIEYALDKILEKNNIEIESIEKAIVPAIPARLELLQNKNVDAALLPEPFASLALNNGGVLLGSGSKEGAYPSVTAFTQTVIDTKSKEIQAFYEGYNEAVDYINKTSIAEYEQMIIEAVGYPEDMAGKISLPVFRKNVLPPEEQIQSVIDWAVKNRLITRSLEPKDLIDDIGVR